MSRDRSNGKVSENAKYSRYSMHDMGCRAEKQQNLKSSDAKGNTSISVWNVVFTITVHECDKRGLRVKENEKVERGEE